MSTLVEIETAAKRLSSEERHQLLILIAQSLRNENSVLPAPRIFSDEQMQEWMDEDEIDMKKLRDAE